MGGRSVCNNYLEVDQVCSNTLVLTQVNTSQHESNPSQHESDTSQRESSRVRHESTRINTKSNTSQHQPKIGP